MRSTPVRDYHKIPKVELHRHLEGSLRLSTMMAVAESQPNLLPQDKLENLARRVQVMPDDPYTFQNFLSKFEILRLFYRSPEIIQRVAREAVEDAAADHVHYMELSFTPVALSRQGGFSMDAVVQWVCQSAQQAAREANIILRFILNVNRHESVELAEKVAALGVDYVDMGVVGLSLSGNEADFLGRDFIPIFQAAKESGLKLTVHSGEWAGPESVRFALDEINADRLAHGVRVLEDPSLAARTRDLQIPFEVCITSNYQSGVVSSLEAHPLMKMLDAGLNVTINTDDPAISRITLADEYRLACEDLGLSYARLRERIMAAAQAAFMAPVERMALKARLEDALDRCFE